MIKKIAILALAVSAAFSNAFAGEDCLVSFSPMADFEFTGEPVKPGVNKVVCSTDEYSASDFTKIDYGENINAGSDAGSVTITVNTGDVITKKFDIDPKGVRISIDNVEKELGGATPELTWKISNLSDMSTLNDDTLNNFISALKKELKLVITFHTTAEAMAMEKACKAGQFPGS